MTRLQAAAWAYRTLGLYQPRPEDTFAVFGGAGWHAMELRRLWPGHLFVHEPASGLTRRPYPWEPNPAPFAPLDTGEHESAMAIRLGPGKVLHIVCVPEYARALPREWEAFRERLQLLVREHALGRKTSHDRTREWATHSFTNAQHFVTARGVGALRGRAKGLPVFVVSAGPSLDRNVDLLEDAKRRGVVLAVNHALPALARAGVVPHAVCAIEGRAISGHFAVPDEYMASQVIATSAHPSLFELPHERRYLLNFGDDTIGGGLLKALGESGAVETSGGSVATMAVGLAVAMGASAVVFVGQDLAYTGGRVYATGAPRDSARLVIEDGVGYIERDRDEMDTGDAPEKVRDRVTPLTVDAWGGGTVQAPQNLCTQRSWFERTARDTGGVRWINATEGGARIAHTTEAALADVLAMFPETDRTASVFVDSTFDERARKRSLRQYAMRRAREMGTIARTFQSCSRNAQRDPALVHRAGVLMLSTLSTNADLTSYMLAAGYETPRPDGLTADELRDKCRDAREAAETVRDEYERLAGRLA